MTETGRKAVRSAATQGAAALALRARQQAVRDPEIGEARNGVRPGEWRDTPGPLGLPPDCPVQPLGFEGENYFFIDAHGQLFASGDKAFGQERIQKLFGDRQKYLYWAWPRMRAGGKVDAWRAEKVREDLFSAAAKKGPWKSFEKVRGLGAWRGKDGALILHCGEFLWSDGKLMPTGELDGYFYPRRPKTFLPFQEPVRHDDNPAPRLLQAFSTWNFARGKVDPFLLLGGIGAMLIGGALPWRPSLFLVGDRGTGKSTLQGLVREIFGSAIVATADTTPAGIYQRIGNDALPVAVDELEAEADNRRASGVLKLARIASSGDVMLRGGKDHEGVEFQARSVFMFSAIIPPPMTPAEASRLGVLNIGKLSAEATKVPQILEGAIESFGPKLLRRMADGWEQFEGLYEEFRTVLRAGGHDSRGQDTYGVLLTCAQLLLGDEGCDALGYPIESLEPWSEWLAAETMPEMEDARENWRACLTQLLTSRVEAWRQGQRQTVGALLDEMDHVRTLDGAPPADGQGISPMQARQMLAQAGLGLVDPGKIPGCEGFALAIPNSGPLVAGMFRGTAWGGEGHVGGWSGSLRQGPPSVIITNKLVNKVKINGVSQRCTLVDLNAFERLTGG